ncbi:MAG: HAMP domain-containing protein [Proteobacteria bacterium]|nr:HAMP domain-containing protein [Pseudomonadota bacterium]
MRLWPRSLFGRMVLLLIAVVAIAAAATFLIFREDRSALLARQFGDTKIVQLQALRAALEATSDTETRREHTARLEREYGVRIVPELDRPRFGAPAGSSLAGLDTRLKEALGDTTELHVAPGRGLLIVKIDAAGTGYWVGFPLRSFDEHDEMPTRALAWTITVAALLLVAAYAFTRYLALPLRELASAVTRVGRGEAPPPLPESGPSEIVALNHGFNTMLGNLRQIERDRALLLAGISHDLRTPLARLRLGVEMGADPSTREGMVSDIEEMDRIVGQFLEFARGEDASAIELVDVAALAERVVARYRTAGKEVRYAGTATPPVPLRPTALSRLIANLVDNALAYAGPPVDVTVRTRPEAIVIEVADRGPGIPAADVERLKLPFTRSSMARSRADGVPGAGLGLAIVERVTRQHGGTFDLLARDGGGTLARVELPRAPAAAASPVLARG